MHILDEVALRQGCEARLNSMTSCHPTQKAIDEILATIFGGDEMVPEEEALINCHSETELEMRFDALKPIWDTNANGQSQENRIVEVQSILKLLYGAKTLLFTKKFLI